eukprot:910491-Pleurochrysis_carterae.AAC.1
MAPTPACFPRFSLQTRTGCNVFVVDKDVPPGYHEPMRLVLLVGSLLSVSYADWEVNRIVGQSESVAEAAAALLPAFHRRDDGWPRNGEKWAERIAEKEVLPGNVRHDLLIEKASVGKLIGPQGSKRRELTQRSGCEMYIVDDVPPPGATDEQRLCVLIGTPVQATARPRCAPDACSYAC